MPPPLNFADLLQQVCVKNETPPSSKSVSVDSEASDQKSPVDTPTDLPKKPLEKKISRFAQFQAKLIAEGKSGRVQDSLI